MTAPLTPERLAGIAARVEGLAPKPDSICPIEATDYDGSLGPCGLPVRTWAWYDGHDHEPMLIACCHGHETEGAESLAQVVATDVPDLLAALDAATERAEKAEAALARVAELADEWEAAGRYAARVRLQDEADYYGANATRVREAMEGKP